jgi:protein O-GlcNAc transferase
MTGQFENSEPASGEERAIQEANQAIQEAQWAENAGLLDKAVVEYRKVTRLFPRIFEVHNNLANVLLTLGRYDEALESGQAALALNPDDALVNAIVGQAWHGCGASDKAIPFLRTALGKAPELHPLRKLLAGILMEMNRAPEAAAVFRESEGQFSNDLEFLIAASAFYHRARLGTDAERCFLRMLTVAPKRVATYNDIAMLYLDFAHFSKARDMCVEGLKLEPRSPALWNTLANAQHSIGLIDESIRSYRRVLEYAPSLAGAHSNLLLVLHYPSGIDPGELFEEHKRWGRMHAPPALATKNFGNAPDPGRRLRIGYLSPDIRRHSVAFFLEPLLDHHDRTRFELYCYANVKSPDEVTRRLKPKFDHYRSIVGLRDAQTAGLIRGDQLDILIDLAGHAGALNAAVLGYKPAPVQVTYLGYPDTTGIAAVDYRITDAVSDPDGAEERYVETLVRLPDGFLCFRPPDNLPEIGAPPGLATGVVTFGSFNREFKVSRLALDLWCRILQAVPGSRIVMKSVAGSDPVTREHQFSEFERRGIARDRVELIGFIASQKDHLATYRTIDIALDTFPYHGTTTTLDSLLMGVPVITLAGYHHASRVGASLLTAVGCPEFIARTEDEYVARAVELASDLEKVRALHGALRQRLLQSPLCDGPGFARKFEYALRGMWCNWCAGGGARLSPAEAAAAAFDFSGLAAGPGRPDAD